MNIFKKKIWIKIIAVICLFLTVSNFGITNKKVYATTEKEEEIWGGNLISPIIRLVTGIADGAVDLIQKAMMDSATSLIEIKEKDNNTKRIWVAFAVILAVIVVAALVAVGGWAVAGVAAAFGKAIVGVSFVLKTAALASVLGIGAGVVVGKVISDEWLAKDLQLPAYKVTSQEIFADEVWLFDVNFFNKDKVYTKKENKLVVKTESYPEAKIFEDSRTEYSPKEDPKWDRLADLLGDDETRMGSSFYLDDKSDFDSYNAWTTADAPTLDFTHCASHPGLVAVIKIINEKNREAGLENFINITEDNKLDIDTRLQHTNYQIIGVAYIENTTKIIDGEEIPWSTFHKKIKLVKDNEARYTIYLTHDSIDSDTDSTIEIIRDAYSSTFNAVETVDAPIESTAQQLNKVVSKWYFVLRNLALLILMLVLIYIGIKIVIGSTAGEKAKYKERLTDWLVALCLVMIMHYIMVFAVELVEKITDLVNTSVGENVFVEAIPVGDKKDEIEEYNDGTYKLSNFVKEVNGVEQLLWPTDLMGAMRIEAQLVNEGTAKWVGYSLCFIVLVCYTLFFSWTYLKRVLYMAFLTMIAPLVAMTYPIDKITDGKAQAFNMWLKEYIFNLLIQPMHLLLYTVLVSSAFELAADSPLYAIVAVGFIVPAEKLIRKFFGFEKAKTPGLLGGAAGAAMTMTGLQSLMKHAPREKGGSGEGTKGKKNDIKFSSSEGVSAVDNAIGNINFDDGVGNGTGNINIQTNKQQMAGSPGNSLTVNTGNGNNGNGQSGNTSGINTKGIQISVSNPNAKSGEANLGARRN